MGQGDIGGDFEFRIRAGGRGVDVETISVDAEVQMKVIADIEIDAAGEGHAQRGETGVNVGMEGFAEQGSVEVEVDELE